MQYETVILAVKQEEEVIRTEDGGLKYVTEAMLKSAGQGAMVATIDNIVMQDSDGTLFYKRTTATLPPTSTYWTLMGDAPYTITGTPVPYTVAVTNVTGNVEIANDVGNAVPTKSILWNGANPVQILQYNTATTGTMYAMATSAVIHGLSSAGGGTYVDAKVSPSGALQVGGSLDVAYGTGVVTPTTQRVVLAEDQQALAVTVGQLPSHPVTNAGTFPVQVTSLPTLNANILTVPAPLNTIGAGNADSALRVQLSNESLAALANIHVTVPGVVDIGAIDITALNSIGVTQEGSWVLSGNSGTDIGDVTINNGNGINAVNVQDGGNSLTVDNNGTFAVQVTSMPNVSLDTTGLALATNQTNVQAFAGVNASKAVAIQGLTDGVLVATTANLQDGNGNAISSTTRGTSRALTVQVVDADGNQITNFGSSGGVGSGGAGGTVQHITNSTVENPAVLIVGGYDGTAVHSLLTDNTGKLVISDGGVSVTVDGTVTSNLSATDRNLLRNLNTSDVSGQGLFITFSDIDLCPVDPVDDVSAWNTYFGTEVITEVKVNFTTGRIHLLANGVFSIINKANLRECEIQDVSGYIVDIINSCKGTSLVAPDRGLIGTCIFDGLRTIGNNCFDYSVLDALSIPLVNHIPFSCLDFCTCKRLHLPELVSVGGQFMQGNTTLTDLHLPKLKLIRRNSFTDCTSLNKAILPEVESIGSGCFTNTVCTSFHAPKLVSIGEGSLLGLAASVEIDWQFDSLEVVGWDFLSGSFGLTGSIRIPATIIDDYPTVYQTLLSSNISLDKNYLRRTYVGQRLEELINLQTIKQYATQSVAVGASSTQSATVSSETIRVILSTTANCWVNISTNPTATAHGAGSFYLAAGASTFPLQVTGGYSKIAVIQEGTSTGYLSILESV